MKKSPGSNRITPQKNTLLNYFARTPGKENNAVASVQSTPSTPRQGPRTPSAKGYHLFDIVWAKLDGYPWWPSIVCNDPQTDTFERSGKIHVQFFDESVSHAWILKRDLKTYESSVQVRSVRDVKLKHAIEAADDALKLELNDRSQLIGPLHCEDNDDEHPPEPVDQDVIGPPKRKAMTETGAINGSKRFKRVCIIDDSDEDEVVGEREDDEYHPESEEEEEPKDFDFDSDFDEDDPSKFKRQSAPTKKFVTKNVLQPKINPNEKQEQEHEKPVKRERQSFQVDPNYVPDDQDVFFTMFGDLDATVRSDVPVTEQAKISKRCKIAGSNRQNLEQAITAEKGQETEWPHLSYPFLQPDQIADGQRNKMLVNGELNPKYDPSTLYIPATFLSQLTPALRQWWELKAQHFDTILFFKMGKFYEFFHMDAVICANELKILFMRGENAHAGFPEKNYKQYADALIQKGYKVARVEQTETPEMMIERCRRTNSCSKFQKVVKRELCRVSTVGTRFLSDVDADASLDSTSYLVAFTGKPVEDSSGHHQFGVCFVDVSIGQLYVAQFRDDRFNTQLRTLFSHHPPVEILMESSSKLKTLIKSMVPSARIQTVKRFWSAAETLKYLYEKKVWSEKTDQFQSIVLEESDPIKQTARSQFELAIASMGAVIQYLDQALILDDILTMGRFQVYQPANCETQSSERLPRHMVLDSMALTNLAIFDQRKEVTTLFKIIDTCMTSFGKRLLRSWTCQPLCGARTELELRQEAVRDLAENDRLNPMLKRWRGVLKAIPDLDRMLVQIHSQSLPKRTHPDSRAILFESDIYRKRRVKAFLDTLAGFERALQLVHDIRSQAEWFQSSHLRKLTTLSGDGGLFPDIEAKLKYFRQSFDEEKVLRDGNFVPDSGVDDEYDEVVEKLRDMEKKLDLYLKKQEEFFQTRIHYVHANKHRYTLEIPDAKATATVLARAQETFELKSTRKGFKRYHTPELLDMVAELEATERQREIILADVYRRLLAKFDQDYAVWAEAIGCVAQLDALMALARTRHTFETNGSAVCMPQLLWDQPDGNSLLVARELRNAFLVVNHSMVANDVQLKNETFILTGPNMGGKTTLMRSVGLAAILAHIGAYVPAAELQLTPVDRLFARIGSSDLMFENESTFMVEVNEALAIVRNASPSSLALIDELGSGTATSDGTAIASAVISELTDHIRCRTMFTTHYHSILDELHAKPNIKVGFMEFLIENQDGDPTEENVIFLYKLSTGVCNKSYGFNVAKLAGIPTPVIRRAYRHAKLLEMQREYGALTQWFRSSGATATVDHQLRTKSDHLFDLVREFLRIEARS